MYSLMKAGSTVGAGVLPYIIMAGIIITVISMRYLVKGILKKKTN